MDERERQRKIIRELFSSQNLAVLSTQTTGQPYSNLIAFAPTEDLKELLFATARTTRKYSYIEADPRVSVLIDNRTNRYRDFSEAVAVTAIGTAREVAKEGDGEHLVKLYAQRHPHLEGFVRSETCALMSVSVEKYIIVSRFQNVMELSAAG
jgi:nitroimidazol reductase NimA-like FMN-containing flavoprotein (pyridoxamine 5'-phosphate oxidase superfamily)